jgi:hypothetical protein
VSNPGKHRGSKYVFSLPPRQALLKPCFRVIADLILADLQSVPLQTGTKKPRLNLLIHPGHQKLSTNDSRESYG